MKNAIRLGKLLSLLLLWLSTTACEKMDHDEPTPAQLSADGVGQGQGIAVDVSFYVVAEGNQLHHYLAQSTGEPAHIMAISGLQPGEEMLGIDFRPATGQLYGLGSSSRLYVLNPATGAARQVGSGPFSPALDGRVVGIDFNPTVDRIRVVTDAGQNLRLHPETGAVAAVDGRINGASDARIAAAAYTNNVAGATTTTLYDLDPATDQLYKQLPPNDGTLVAVGSLRLDLEGAGGFDIAPGSGLALGLFEVNKKATLFTVDLATGEARVRYKFNKQLRYSGLAIPTAPVAYALGSPNRLLIINPEQSASAVARPIAGLNNGEELVGLDFRPATSQLYAVSNAGRLFTLNTASGAATMVATLSTSLEGTAFGVDFNPVADRLRIVSNTGQNLRVNPTDGVTVVDGPLNPGMPMITGAAYTNSMAGATTTTLYDIDAAAGKLYRQVPPNAGTLVEVGNLGVSATATTGFDIGGTSNMGYALLTVDGVTRLYYVNLQNGAVTALNSLGESAYGFALGLGF